MLLLTFINCRIMTGTLPCFYRWLNCLMPDTSPYLISCRSFLRARGITTLFATCFREYAFLKHIRRIYRSVRTFDILDILFFFFFFPWKNRNQKKISCIPELCPQKELQGCQELKEMVQHPHRIHCMADLYGRRSLAVSKWRDLRSWKMSFVIILPSGRTSLVYTTQNHIGCSNNHTQHFFFFFFGFVSPSWRKEGTHQPVTSFMSCSWVLCLFLFLWWGFPSKGSSIDFDAYLGVFSSPYSHKLI